MCNVRLPGPGTTTAINQLVSIISLKDAARCKADRPCPLAPAVVFIGPYEHHSNILPWREAGARVIIVDENPEHGGPSLNVLEQLLRTHVDAPRRRGREIMAIGSFSTTSNVTGAITDTEPVTRLLHRHGALSFWDYAARAAHARVEMNPSSRTGGADAELRKDALFFSPHKLLGGPGCPGVLVVKRHLFRNKTPTRPGGGTVMFVNQEGKPTYLLNKEEREEGGTPDIVGTIRCGLVMQLLGAVGVDNIERIEEEMVARAMEAWQPHPRIVIHRSSKGKHASVVSFNIRHAGGRLLHWSFVAQALNDVFGLQCRGGCMCAGPYGFRLLGLSEEEGCGLEQQLLAGDEMLRPGFVRLSFPYYMSPERVTMVINAVVWMADHADELLPVYVPNRATGEYRFKTFKTPPRRWLNAVSYASGRLEYPSLRREMSKAVLCSPGVGAVEADDDADCSAGEAGIPALFNQYRAAAESVIDDATRLRQALAYNERSLLSEAGCRLRWFAVPGDEFRTPRTTCARAAAASGSGGDSAVAVGAGASAGADAPAEVAPEVVHAATLRKGGAAEFQRLMPACGCSCSGCCRDRRERQARELQSHSRLGGTGCVDVAVIGAGWLRNVPLRTAAALVRSTEAVVEGRWPAFGMQAAHVGASWAAALSSVAAPVALLQLHGIPCGMSALVELG